MQVVSLFPKSPYTGQKVSGSGYQMDSPAAVWL